MTLGRASWLSSFLLLAQPCNAADVCMNQLRLALRLCNENKSHQASLRMDVVRAWLELPELQHPADHRCSFDEP